MIEIDPAIADGWRQDGLPNGLRLEVEDPVGAWPALCDVCDEIPTSPTPQGWSEALVLPDAVLFRCVADDPSSILVELVKRLGQRGIGRGMLTVDTTRDDSQPGALLDVVDTTSWIVAWLVPLMVPGISFTYRSLREWRIRRFPGEQLQELVTAMVERSPHAEARVGWPGGVLHLPASDLPVHTRHWLEHGITTTSGLGEPEPGASVVTTSVLRGTELVGLGYAGVGLVDDVARASAHLDELTEVIVGLADLLAYAVIGVHETGRMPAMGTPFREAVPATARARSRGLSLAALDQWVLDAAPVQLLSPHHVVSERDGVIEKAVGNHRRLVRIGTPEDWFSGSTRRTQVRNYGRLALAACLPPPRTPMPASLL